jgi:hypothetical protein
MRIDHTEVDLAGDQVDYGSDYRHPCKAGSMLFCVWNLPPAVL